MTPSTHIITPPSGWDFWRTVRSHGWYDLSPFHADPDTRSLELILRLHDGTLTLARLRQQGKSIRCSLQARRPLSSVQRHSALSQVRSCLRLDEDFRPFHDEARRHTGYRWIADAGAGRLLRAPTAFEDTIKMICTTNCSWALTKIMVRNLVGLFGERWDTNRSGFPTPEAIAGATEDQIRREVRAGYRAPYILRLAEEVASGARVVESWRESTLPTGELFAELLKVRGVGPYAAGSLLKLLGRYDHLALDSWVRGQYASLHARGRRVSDATIERAYRPYGKWRGLFFWLEMTRYWHEDKFSANTDKREGWTA